MAKQIEETVVICIIRSCHSAIHGVDEKAVREAADSMQHQDVPSCHPWDYGIDEKAVRMC